VTDYNIPLISGDEMIKQAKSQFKKLQKESLFPKVIMLTGVEDSRLKTRMLEKKLVDVFLTKP
jgi:response regulator RpfG family c-di-GMP phosphodiesterase